MRKTSKISALIPSLFPDHVVANYPRLIEFAQAFFEYLEEQNKSSYYQNSIPLQRDIREQDPEFLEYIQRELGILNAQRFAADPKVFYDNIAQIWRSKGSEESIKAFFRIFLDDEVDVFYPWESVLIPSDGRWIVDTVIRISPILGNPESFAGKRIFQVGSDATAVVDSVERKIYSDGIIYELKLVKETIAGTFFENKTIYVDETLTAEVYRSVNAIAVKTPGSGYKIGDKVTLAGYVGMTFTAYVDAVDPDGGIISIALADFGSGNTPFSVIANSSRQYFLIDFVFYNFPAPEDIFGLITQTGEEPFVNYGLITEAATLAEDYGSNLDPIAGVLSAINIDSAEGTGAELVIKYGPLATYKGYYKGVKGQLSESIVLQDSKYYQKFSYEVKTTVSSSNWIQPLKKFAHPAGMEVIGNVFTFQKLNVGIKDYFIFVRSKDPVSYTFVETPGLSESLLGFTQDYYENEGVYFAEDYFGVTAFFDQTVIPGQPTEEIFDDTYEPQDL